MYSGLGQSQDNYQRFLTYVNKKNPATGMYWLNVDVANDMGIPLWEVEYYVDMAQQAHLRSYLGTGSASTPIETLEAAFHEPELREELIIRHPAARPADAPELPAAELPGPENVNYTQREIFGIGAQSPAVIRPGEVLWEVGPPVDWSLVLLIGAAGVLFLRGILK